MDFSRLKIALVHDYLVQYGGAERVLEAFCEIFPHAPIYTLLYDKDAMNGRFSDRRIYTSRLQSYPFAKTHHRLFPMLMTSAIEEFDFTPYDVVLSDSASYAKGVITRPETTHISYIHTPMRYAWDDCQNYTREFHFPSLIKKTVPYVMNSIRLWDRGSADRVDHFIANSDFIARRIQKYYHKDAHVIHPPVLTDHFSLSETQKDYYLIVGRLISYKRFDLAINAFNQLKKPLYVIGRGPEMERLKSISGDNIRFLGRVSDQKLRSYYAQAKAVLFPQEEDFGIVAIEALASGRPIIAYRGGDIVEHVQEGKSCVFFNRQDVSDLKNAVHRFEQLSFDPEQIRRSALRFDVSVFKEKIRTFVEDVTSSPVDRELRIRTI